MWGIINDAGWPIWPLIFTSVIGLAIILERFFSLRDNIIIPKDLMSNLETQLKNGVIKKEELEKIGVDSLAGLMMTAVIKNQGKSLEILNDTIVKTGDAISHRLEKNLHILAMISTVAPLLGLFGTIVGMVELFSSFTSTGHDVEMFARGISVALYNTAGGIVVAIPAMISHRYFRAKIDEQIQTMEEHADHVVDLINGRK
jgi:biopolymer transport protein ExbB